MFCDPDRHDYLINISRSHDVIKREFDKVVASSPYIHGIVHREKDYLDHFIDGWVMDNGFHAEQIGYDIRDGAYTGFAIFKDGEVHPGIDFSEHFVETLKLARGVPGLRFSAFVVMAPGAVLKAHSHKRRHYIYHTLLGNLDGQGCEMTCGNEVAVLKDAGDRVLFDYSIPHGSVNHASVPRINFLVDFEPEV